MPAQELSDVTDKMFKTIVSDIKETSKEYMKHEPNWVTAVRYQKMALDQFIHSPGALYHVALASQIVFRGVNENKLSRLYGALAYFLDTKALPRDYAEITSLGVSTAAA